MAAGRGGDEQKAAKLWGYRDAKSFTALLDVLGDCVAAHLIAQIDAGADAVQIFDSWASGLPAEAFARWVVAPTKRIVGKVRESKPHAKIIGFPRAATLQGYEFYAGETGVDGISVDTSASQDWMSELDMPVQGNFDPLLLVAGGSVMERAVDALVDEMRGKPFIFNLGHGVLQETPPEHVSALVARVRK
jgi:uroporphyrinogen decarboxylase